MGLRKGQTNNPKGRPVGALTKISKELRENITSFLEDHFDEVTKEWLKLEGRDKLHFYRELLQYSIPKMQSVEMKSEFEKLSDEDLAKIVNELKNNIK